MPAKKLNLRPYLADISLIPPGPKRTEFIAHVARLLTEKPDGTKILNGSRHRRRVLKAIHDLRYMQPTKIWKTIANRLHRKGIDFYAVLAFKIPDCDRDLDFFAVLENARSICR